MEKNNRGFSLQPVQLEATWKCLDQVQHPLCFLTAKNTNPLPGGSNTSLCSYPHHSIIDGNKKNGEKYFSFINRYLSSNFTYMHAMGQLKCGDLLRKKLEKEFGNPKDRNQLIRVSYHKGFGQRCQDMNPSFLFLWPPSIHQCSGEYRLLCPLQTTVVSNLFLASSGPEVPNETVSSKSIAIWNKNK